MVWLGHQQTPYRPELTWLMVWLGHQQTPYRPELAWLMVWLGHQQTPYWPELTWLMVWLGHQQTPYRPELASLYRPSDQIQHCACLTVKHLLTRGGQYIENNNSWWPSDVIGWHRSVWIMLSQVIHLRAISQEMLKIFILDMTLKLINLVFQPLSLPRGHWVKTPETVGLCGTHLVIFRLDWDTLNNVRLPV